MPVKERTPKERRHQLNHEEEQELWLGPTRRGSVFESAAQVATVGDRWRGGASNHRSPGLAVIASGRRCFGPES